MRGSTLTGLVSSFPRDYSIEISNQGFQLRPSGKKPHQHVATGQQRLVTPEPFPKQAFGTIAIHSARKEAFGNDQTQAGIFQTIGFDLDGNRPCAAGPGGRKDFRDRAAA